MQRSSASLYRSRPSIASCTRYAISWTKTFMSCKSESLLVIQLQMRRHHYFQVQALYNRRLRTSARQRGDASETAAAAGLTSVGAKVPVYNQQQQEKLSREDFHSLLFREFFEAL
eukprot:10235-Eustigmatos_ZCMA.PRE.1